MTRKITIDERFKKWTADNPAVVGLYLKFARQVLESGRKHWSIKAITERVRWECNIAINRDGEFRINNNYSAPMARLLVEIDPRLKELFVFRKRRA